MAHQTAPKKIVFKARARGIGWYARTVASVTFQSPWTSGPQPNVLVPKKQRSGQPWHVARKK
jgi:hypothetical protein